MRMVAVVALLTACSSHYIPRSRGRVGVIMQSGIPAYVRDGEIHPHGFFGAGLQEAVRGNPAAERDAVEYHDRQVDGFLAAIVGSVCMPVAVGYLAAESIDNQSSNTTNQEIAAGAAIGCTALMFGGLFWAASAEPYRWDAINRFNDTDPVVPQGPPGYSASLPPPNESLKMRD